MSVGIREIQKREIYNVKEHDYIISKLNLCKQPSHTPFPHLYGLSRGRNKSFKNTEKIWEGRQSVGLISNVISLQFKVS